MKKLPILLLTTFLLMPIVHASQSSHVIANDNGATVRAAINTSLQALASNNAGATAPVTTYANMWWYDTSTAILKKRDNANSAWVNVAYNSGSGWIPYYSGTQLGDVSVLTKDTDGTLAANSDTKVATQKATKTAIDAVSTVVSGKFSKTTSGEIAALTEKTTLVDNDLFLINDSESSNALKKVKKSNVNNNLHGVQTFNASGTFIAPTGVSKVYLTLLGGGGPGGTPGNPGRGGGGAGGTLIMNYPYTVIAGNSYTVTVGGSGSDTSFDGTIRALAGVAGDGLGNGGVNLSDSASGTNGVTPGFLGFPGGSGGTSSSNSQGGSGGATPFGAGAQGRTGSGSGSSAANNTGAGGGGGTAGSAGGDGGSGIAIVSW